MSGTMRVGVDDKTMRMSAPRTCPQCSKPVAGAGFSHGIEGPFCTPACLGHWRGERLTLARAQLAATARARRLNLVDAAIDRVNAVVNQTAPMPVARIATEALGQLAELRAELEASE